MKNFTLKEEFQKLKTLHISFVLGLLLVCLLFYFMHDKEDVELITAVGAWEVLAVGWALIGFVIIFYLNRKNYPTIKNTQDVEEKWNAYRIHQIRKYSLIESAGLISALVFMMCSNLYLLLFALLLVLLLYQMKPKVGAMISGLDFPSSELM